MDKEQFKKFVQTMTDAYPNWDPKTSRLELWADMLSDLNYFVAMARLKKHIATSKYPPSIAEILNPEEAAKSKNRQETDGLSPAVIMNGGYQIYVPPDTGSQTN
ncbi:MAG: hypothetical protein GXY34_05250 [Syntrophomonadaceae bacterium]|nr:hypothetical protein [Syntrophomonadaceae bacterium]